MNSFIDSTAGQYFLDTSFLIAILDQEDVHHNRAKEIFTDLPNPNGRNIFLSDVVINEILTVLARRGVNKKNGAIFRQWSEPFRQILPDYPILCLYDALATNYRKIINLMDKHEGRLGFHDSLIALFLKEVPNVKLVSFDEEFKALGWLDVLS